MHPQISINFMAIIVAVLVSFVFGWLWHGPLLGKTWMKLMKVPADFRPGTNAMLGSSVIALVGTFLMAYVLTHSLEIWRPSVWGIGSDQAFYVYGFFAGFFTWIGFIVPMLLNGVAWENRSWRLFGLNAAYQFVNLQILSMILACWR